VGSRQCIQGKGGKILQFSIGDKVVHPHHGPGQVAGIESREFMDGKKRYYVIHIPDHGLIIHMPVENAEESGMRLAISESRLPRVLNLLRDKPRTLPQNYKERQEQVSAELRTGRVMPVARVVRDLTWHRERAHLTRRDQDILKHGQSMLAAELALVSGDDVLNASELIEATIASALHNPVS
jgi:CarD family transcriptional regulator